MKRPFLPKSHQSNSIVSLFGLTIFFLLFILGCGRGGGEVPQEGEAAPQQQGTFVCSEECAARGQCGKTVNGDQTVILGHPERPVVKDHQMTFPAEDTLPIVSTKEELVEVVSTGEQFSQIFFLLQRADERVGWVAGWCFTPQ